MFEKLKESFRRRIETDAVKLENLQYRMKKDSEPITEPVVYLKRSKIPLTGDWQRIYPPVNEDGTWNVVNLLFGGWKNLIRLLIIGAIIATVYAGFNELFQYIRHLEGLVPQHLIIA